MRDPRLPDTVGSLTVRDDGVLFCRDVDAFPWYTKEGFLGGTVRYRLVAEEVDIKELCKTQETQ
jgi:hypothetical protein